MACGTRIRASICRSRRPAGRSALTAAPSTRCSAERRGARLLVWPVGLLFDEPRAELQIDALLDRGALIVRDVDGARELDEVAVEALRASLSRMPVLDVPQPLVHRSAARAPRQSSSVRRAAELCPAAARAARAPGARWRACCIADARALDAQDRDLVEQLARRRPAPEYMSFMARAR